MTLDGLSTLKVNRVITGATTVNANACAEVTYIPNSGNYITGVQADMAYMSQPYTRCFGPSQSIPANISVTMFYSNGSSLLTATINYALVSGFEFVNS